MQTAANNLEDVVLRNYTVFDYSGDWRGELEALIIDH